MELSSQFKWLPINQVMNAKSPDAVHEDVGDTVEDTRHYKMSSGHNGEDTYDWDRLHTDVANHGIQKPLHFIDTDINNQDENNDLTLTNGHHRAIAASNVGQMFVPAVIKRFKDASGEEKRKVLWQHHKDASDDLNESHYTEPEPEKPVITSPPRKEVPGQLKLPL